MDYRGLFAGRYGRNGGTPMVKHVVRFLGLIELSYYACTIVVSLTHGIILQ
jgi:hypothetical protein